jgi:hypothetical protein
VTLDEEMTGFLQQGLAIHIGTRNDQLEPNGARVVALRVDDDRQHIVAFIPAIAAPRVLRDLEANGQGAIAVARPVDDRAAQVKGVFVESWTATDADRETVETQWRACSAQLEMVGIPPAATANWAGWPCVAVRLRINAVFDQTPGPKAGAAVP